MTGAGMDSVLADFQNKKAPYFLVYCKKKSPAYRRFFLKQIFDSYLWASIFFTKFAFG